MSEPVITLNELKEADIASIARQLNNENVARYLSSKIPFPYTESDAKWFIEEGSKIGINKAIYFQNSLVGVTGMVPGSFEYERSGEIGYWLGQDHWGKGIATAAVTQLTNHVFEHTQICRLVAPVFGPNHASIRVLEKCGYKLEAIQKQALFKHGKLYDSHVFVKVHHT